jgi:uncharacterized protein YcbX
LQRTVARISYAPVQGFRLLEPDAVALTLRGIVDDRRFFLIDAHGARLRSSLTAWPVRVRGEYDPSTETLRMRFPDGRDTTGDACPGRHGVAVDVHGRYVEGHVVDGPWTEQLSALADHGVRLVRTLHAGDYQNAPVTLLSVGALTRLERELGAELDPRRFRMTFLVDGYAEHEEDGWTGKRVRIGDAVLRGGVPVPRCAVTTRDPETGSRDLDTLGALAGYRPPLDDGGLPFGIYATVERPGEVRLGDAVELLD